MHLHMMQTLNIKFEVFAIIYVTVMLIKDIHPDQCLKMKFSDSGDLDTRKFIKIYFSKI